MNVKREQSKFIKLILLIAFVAVLVIGTQFAVAKFVATRKNETELYFYEYRINSNEIVISPEFYTGEEVTVEITTEKAGLSVQYRLEGTEEWIDYTGPFSVDKNMQIDTRLVSEADSFEGPITEKEIKNIAVAKIGDVYYKTLEEAIADCPKNAGNTQTKIEMLTNVTENVVIPEGKNIVLDLCGATITGAESEEPTVTVSGDFNLIDSAKNEDGTLQGDGKVVSNDGTAIKVTETGNFVLGTNESATGANQNIDNTNPVVQGATYGVEIDENGKFGFYDGNISGKTNAINGKVTDKPEGYDVATNVEGEYEVAILKRTMTVTFDANGGKASFSSKKVTTSMPYGNLATVEEREGYVFLGWRTANNQISTNQADWEIGSISNNGVATENSTKSRIRLKDYLKVSPNTQYRMTTNNSESINIRMIVLYDKNYNFLKVVEDVGFVMGTGNKTEFIVPENCEYIKVSLMKGNGTADGASISLEDLTKANIELYATITENTKVIAESDHTLKAEWQANTYTVAYSANGGTGTIESVEATYDNEITLPENTLTAPEGYTFKEWNTKADGKGTGYNPGDKVKNLSSEQSATVSLYAIWEDKTAPTKTAPTGTGTTNTITVNSNQADNGSGIDEETIEYAIYKDGKWSDWQSSNVFEGLNANTEYQVKTRVTDKDGNGPIESEVGKISTSKIESGSIKVHKDNAKGDVITPETSADNKENPVNNNLYIDITPSQTGTTTVTVKTPDGNETKYTQDTTITTGTGMYEIIVETTDGTNTVTDTYYIYVDKTVPTLEPTVTNTTNTITVNANAQDTDSGVADVTYTIKKGNEVVKTNKTGEFTGLEDNTEYTVEITVTDNAGNKTTTTEIVETQKLVAGSIEFTETTNGTEFIPTNKDTEEKVWTNGNVGTELIAGNAGTTYEVTSPDGTKTTYEADTQIATQEGTYTVKVTTTDGTNTETVTYYFSIDKTKPTVAIDPNGKQYTLAVGNNTANLEVKLVATDSENGSGIAETKYAWSTSNEEAPTAWSDFVTNTSVTNTVQGGVYYLWTNVTDKAGNEAVSIKTSNEFNVGYAVEYDVNGGEGKITSQRKEHGVNLKLTEQKPTKDMYIFKGWATSADSTVAEYTENALYTTDESVKLYAVWSEVVASTTIDGVTTNYDSVQGAINAAGTNKGAVVTLLKDEIAENVTVAAGQNIVLDVNGKTLKHFATSGYTINNMGELTIIGEGTIIGNTSNATIKSNTTGKTVIDGNCQIIAVNHYPISNNNIFIVNNGTIISESSYAIHNYETGKVEINGGSLQGVTYGIVNDKGNVIITEGTVQGNTHGIINRGNLTITGGIIKGQYAINNNVVSKTLITGGEILSDNYINHNGNLEITGGKIYGKIDGIRMADLDTAVLTIGTNEENPSVDITSPVIIGESCGINNSKNYTLNFYDGIIMGSTNQTIKGTVTDTPTGYRVVNGTQIVDGVEYETAYLDNTYYITFDDNCTNGTTTTLDKKYNNKLETLPTPTTQVTGYTFDGWYTDKIEGTKITANTLVKEDVTYYAHWVPNPDTAYTVYHYRENANDSKYELIDAEILKGTSDSTLELANLSKAGEDKLANCTVLKTALTENGESELTTTIAANGTTKIYIYYTRNTFSLTVTEGDNVNTVTGSGTYKWGQTVNLTAEVESLDGYKYSNFAWATNSENIKIEDIVADKTKTNTTLTMPAEEISVFANSDRTTITYDLTYNLDGGKMKDGKTNPSTYTVENEITLNPAEKQGYVFLGWRLSKLNGKVVEDSTVVDTILAGTTGDREYTAIYNNGEVSYTVYHYLENANNSEYTLYNTQSVEAKTNDVIALDENVAIEIANATYAKSTETLNGEQGTNVTVQPDSSTKIYVYYTRNTYKLNVLAGDNIGAIKINDKAETQNTFKYGETVNISATLANLNGYTYSNFRWETSNESILASIIANNTTLEMPAANTTVTAVADREINTYNITYTLDGGTVEGKNPTTYTVESDNITLINPTKIGYTFAGWTGTGLTEPTKNVIISTGSYGNKQYTATWTINEYTVTYDYASNGGKNSTVTSAKFDYNTQIDLTPVATKDNYEFIGWNTNKNATTGLTTLKMGTKDVTLYAIYSKDVVVKFDKNGGSEDVTATYKMYNTNVSLEITMPEPTTFAGWTFNGYASTNNATSGDAKGTTKTITVAENVTNVTYYHTWKKQVTFNANKPANAEDSYKVTMNEAQREIYYNNSFGTLPTNPTLSGWTFAGWFTSNNGGTQITQDTLAQEVPANVYAKWTLSTSISVSPETVVLDLSDNKTQKIAVTGSNYGNVTYESEDSKIATVDENGVITAVKNGTTTIIVTGSNGKVTDTTQVTVVTRPTSIKISQDSSTIGVVANNTVQLNATVGPETANEDNKVTWTSSNESIAKVDPVTGVVTGISDGKVIITAATENGCTDTCEITVDGIAPTVEVSMDNANYKKSHTATITITDTVSGLPASQEISYAWTTNKDEAPENWNTTTVTATAGATSASTTIEAPSDLTGVYYLWGKSGIKDNFENTTTQNYINTQATANLDNIAPTVTINPNTKEYTIAVGENMATIGTTITATDNENGSGIAITKYAWSTSNTQEPEAWLDFTNAVEVTKTVEGGKYYVWTNVEDTAGNKAVSVKTSGEFNVGYAVEYNANGGEGEIASQRKEYGVNLTLTNEKPTRDMYIFKGWATSADSATVEYAANALYKADASVRLYAVWSEVIASTTIDGVTTNYDSVQGAIDAAGTNPGATVTLLKDEIIETATVAAGQDIELNVNGKTWRNVGSQTITNNGNLTIVGDGLITGAVTYAIVNNGTFEKYGDSTIEYTGTANYALRNAGIANLYEGTITSSKIGVENKEGGKLIVDGITIQTTSGQGIRNLTAETESESLSNPSVIIKSGLIESTGSNAVICCKNRVVDIQGGTIKGITAIQILENGIVNITGATVEGDDGINNYNNGQVFVNEGSTIIGNKTRAITNLRDGMVTITGGTLIGEVYGIHVQAQDDLVGVVKITGGNIYGKEYGIFTGRSTVIIGEDDGVVDIEKPVIVSDGIGVYKSTGNFEFYDGIIKAPEGKTISGTVNKMPEGYHIENGTETIEGVEYETSYLVPNNYEELTSTGTHVNYYVTLADATANVTSGNTIKLLNNTEETTRGEITDEKTVIFDLNGYTITNPIGPVLKTNGELTITGEGTISGATDQATVVNAGTKTLTVESGEFKTTGIVAIAGTGSGKVVIGTEGNTSTANPKIIGSVTGEPADIYVHSGTITATTGKAVNSHNNITITGGHIKSADTNQTYVVYAYKEGAVITITGGIIEQTGEVCAVTTSDAMTTSKVNISGGKIIANSSIGVNNHKGETIITGGEITAKTGVYTETGKITVKGNPIITGTSEEGIRINGGTGVLTGGTIRSVANNGVYVNSGTLTLGSWSQTDTDAPSKTTPKVIGGTDANGVKIENGTFNFYDGIIEGIEDGAIATIDTTTNIPTPKYEIKRINANGRQTAIIVATNYEEVTSTGTHVNYYETVVEATANVTSGNTIKLLNNTEETTRGEITDEKTVIFDLNGYTITNPIGPVLKTNGELTIKGTGRISGATDAATVLNTGAKTLTIQSGEIKTSGVCAVAGTSTGKIVIGTEGNASITNPKITGSITGQPADIYVHSGSITATTGKAVNSNGNITITGGYIKSADENQDYVVYGNTANSIITITGGTIEQTGNIYAVTTSNSVIGTKVNISGGTIIANSNIAVNNHKGETAITGGEITAKTGVYTEEGTVKVSGGKIIATERGIEVLTGNVEVSGTANITGSAGIFIREIGTATIKENATLIGTTVQGLRIGNGTGLVAGGTIKGETDGIYVDSGNVTITGGTIEGNTQYGIQVISGKVTVEGGKVSSSTNHGIYVNGGILTLGSWSESDTDKPSIITPQVVGGESANGVRIENGTFNFYDGIIEGREGGAIATIDTTTNIPTPKYEIKRINANGRQTAIIVATNYEEVTSKGIHVNYYETLADATAKVTSGNTIKLLKDVTDGSSADIELAEGKTVTLDLNGYKVLTSQRIENSGTLEIKDSKTGGTYQSDTIIPIHNINSGTFTLTSGTIKKTTSTNGQTVVHNVGNSKFTMNGGTIESDVHGVVNSESATTVINGGTINAQFNALLEDTVRQTDENDPGIVVKGGTITSVKDAVLVDEDCTSAVIIEGGELTTTGAYPTVLNQGNGLVIIDKQAQITGNYGNGTVSNGYSFQALGDYATGTIEIRGGTITSPGMAVFNEELGTINISGGTITAQLHGVINYREGTINVTGGNITGAWGVRNNEKAGTINVSGGTITATEKAAVGTYKGIATITGGSIIGATYGVYTTAGTTVITGGTITATGGYMDSGEEAAIGAYIGKGLVVEGAEEVIPGTLTIGSWQEGDTDAPSTTVPSIEGAMQGVMHEGGTFNFYDGVIKGLEDNAIRGGTSQIPTGYAVQKTTSQGVETAILIAKNYAEYNGSTFVKYYGTIEEAFEGVTSGNTIKPLKNVTDGSTQDIELASEKNVTLDLNGYTITTTQRLVNTGTLQIKDSKTGGTLNRSEVGSSKTAIYNIGNGSLTVNSGKIQSVGHGIVNGENGKVVFNNGTIEADLNALRDDSVAGINENNPSIVIKGGTITSEKNVLVIYSESNCAVVIEGGELTTTGEYPTVLNQGNSLLIIDKQAQITGNYKEGIVSNGYLYPTTGEYATGTINIRGGTITGPRIAVYNEELGTINISGGDITGQIGVYIEKGGPVNVSGGTITTTTSAGIYNDSTGSVLINGTANLTGSVGAFNNSTGSITVSGNAKLTGTNAQGLRVGAGKGIVTGGTISGTTDGIYVTTGEVTVTGGSITGARYGAYVSENGKLTIGSNNGTVSITTPTITSTASSTESRAAVYVMEDTVFSYYDGKISGVTAIKGTIDNLPTGYEVQKTTSNGIQTAILVAVSSAASISEEEATTYLLRPSINDNESIENDETELEAITVIEI